MADNGAHFTKKPNILRLGPLIFGKELVKITISSRYIYVYVVSIRILALKAHISTEDLSGRHLTHFS